MNPLSRRLTLALALSCVTYSAWPMSTEQWISTLNGNLYGPPHNTISPDTTGGKAPFRAHDALADGMPTYWNWSRGAVKMQWNTVAEPTEEVRVTPILTGRFGDAVPDTHGKNYRAHVRNFELWYYGEQTRTWVLLDKTKAYGAHYKKSDFSKTASITAVNESDGSVSFPALTDNWIHFYTSTWPYRFPSEKFLYLHARAELKISGPDSASAKVLGNAGIDYKSVGPDGRSVNGNIVPAALQAAMRYVTPQYQWFTATTMTSAEISAYTPPNPVSNGPAVTLGVSPSTIAAGQSATLSWSAAAGSSCVASGAWAGNKAISGTQSVSPTSAGTYTYGMSCSTASGTTLSSATLTVTAPQVNAPAVSFSASPTSLVLGSATTLSWSSSNATSCTASGSWSGSKSLSGSQPITPTANGTYAYNLSCTGSGGTTQRTASVSVSQPANRLPAAVGDAFTVRKRTTTTLDVLSNDSDADGDPLTIIAVSAPDQSGEATIIDGGLAISYKPRAGLLSAFTGIETFTYTLSDGQGGSDTGTVTMTVTH